jgi:hypothetical protein
MESYVPVEKWVSDAAMEPGKNYILEAHECGCNQMTGLEGPGEIGIWAHLCPEHRTCNNSHDFEGCDSRGLPEWHLHSCLGCVKGAFAKFAA